MLRVAGAGMGLPVGQALYPTNELPNVPYGMNGNKLSLAAGQSFQIPAGDFIIDLGKYSILEYQDPTETGTWSQVAGVWKLLRSQRGTFYIRSDGQNYRISNLTGCAVGATVTAGGTTYAQASTTVTPSTGNSTWQAIVGGRLTNLTCSVVGAGYGIAPVVYIPPPPGPGIQASAIATISAGAINGFTIVNSGAGYASNPTVTILPNPYDPNIFNGTAITTAVAAFGAAISSGDLSAVICTNPGAPVANTMTLTVTSAVGSGATASPNFLETVTKLSIVTAGSGSVTNVGMTTIGGIPTNQTNSISTETFLPRPLQATFTVSGGGAVSAPVIIDGGMFLMTGTASPLQFLQIYGAGYDVAGNTAPVVNLKLGSSTDTILVQPM